MEHKGGGEPGWVGSSWADVQACCEAAVHHSFGTPRSVALMNPACILCPLQVSKLAKNEVLMLNIGSMCTGARVIAVSAAGDGIQGWNGVVA